MTSGRWSAAALLAVAVWQRGALSQPRDVSGAPVRGLYNWVHTTGDAERAFAFYRDVFGVELARSPFAGPPPADSPAERVRPAAESASDPLVADLTDTQGARFRTAFMRTGNTPFGLELSEFFDIPRDERIANPWDPGAAKLVFDVRDLDATIERLERAGAEVVTLGRRPLVTPNGRSMLVRDPDGFLVEVRQASAGAIARAPHSDAIVATSIGITVEDIGRALAFYRGLLGFGIDIARRATRVELRLNGLASGTLTQAAGTIPGTSVAVVLSSFTSSNARPFHWKIQDVGAPQFQLQVSGLDALLERVGQAGYRILSVGARPIRRPFGRFVFVIDADGVLVELVEPAA
jgi:predicted enzyme related to lactoylglutathione lyase